MVYAPVVIITLNRVEHLKKCIDSLRENSLATKTHLFISVDYPPNNSYVEGYNAVCKYLSGGVDGFEKVSIFYQEKNLGLVRNKDFIENKAFEIYDRIIFSEDDNEFSKSFLEYMNKCLEMYEKYDDILSIYANQPDTKEIIAKEDRVFKIKDFSAYGFGTWRAKYRRMLEETDRDFIEKICCDDSLLRKIAKYNSEVFLACVSILLRKEKIYCLADGSVPKIDMVYMIYYIVKEKYMVCSTVPLVRNWGYDGSGINCQETKIVRKFMRELSEDGQYDVCLPTDLSEYNVVRLCSKKESVLRPIRVMIAYLKILIWRIISNKKAVKYEADKE